MAKKKGKKKIRADFRKNRTARTRQGDLTRQYDADDDATHDTISEERLSGKGAIARKRTVVGQEVASDDGPMLQLDVDLEQCQPGRVLSVHGLLSQVEAEDKRVYRCATRRILKTLATDERHVVAAGDRVYFRPEGDDEGMIERVEPRSGVLSRTSRGRKQIIVANVEQLVIVMSAAEPRLKPNLIDRYLISAEKADITPIICINKIDLVDPAELMPLVGVYAQLGYRTLLVSAETGFGVDRLRDVLRDRESVLSGQSGVGKSSLLNAIDEGLALRVSHVSTESQKGRHTTT
ncbi:MAG: ribosome small subunit-dependent GTPase A, partial [Pirellulales bacterium]|nr:ribosome small subunit-dependent GTPase A [Pirellulales bacterium]